MGSNDRAGILATGHHVRCFAPLKPREFNRLWPTLTRLAVQRSVCLLAEIPQKQGPISRRFPDRLRRLGQVYARLGTELKSPASPSPMVGCVSTRLPIAK
jgi:hypothetical protein